MKLSPLGPFPRFRLAASLALLATAQLAAAATDPDVDPAEPIELAISSEAQQAMVTAANAFLQETAEGLRYLRVDYEITNLSGEPLIGHRWNLTLQGIETQVVSGGLIEPGETMSQSFLLFGLSVDKIDSGGTGGGFNLAGATSAGSRERYCTETYTQEQCEAIGISQQELCNGQKIGQGCAAGVMVCDHSCFRDPAGVMCCTFDPRCACVGRPAGLTLNEAIFEGLMPSDDPYINPAIGDERWLEVRPNSPPDP